MSNLFAAIPSVDLCKNKLFDLEPSLAKMPPEILRKRITSYWDTWRQKIKAGQITSSAELALPNHLESLRKFIHLGQKSNLQRVINATGVVVHTNLGRSVLAKEAQEAVSLASSSYTNLEFDVQNGTRGSRYSLVENWLSEITGAEAAVVVNNNAAAVMLMLDTFCQGLEVILARGELVEIGGSFRIPEVMRKSGAILHEVGATNRTHLQDYANAIGPKTRAIMRVHTSNYRIVGFHSQVSLEELAHLAKANNLLLLEDLGSGSLIHFGATGLPDEPTVQETVRFADLVSFSGDKVLGGPQAGIIVGRHDLIAKLKKNQLTRALRCDKLCLAALEASLKLYLDPELAKKKIPTLKAILTPKTDLASQAEHLARGFKAVLSDKCEISCQDFVSRVGGGAFPQYDLPTTVVLLKPHDFPVEKLKRALLQVDPPVIGHIEHDAFALDPRTLVPTEYPELFKAVLDAFVLAAQMV